MTSKYAPLQQYLRDKASSDREISLALDMIESIIGSPLPKSAFKYRQWWSNQSDISNRPQAKAWTEAGYKVESVLGQLSISSVRFIRR